MSARIPICGLLLFLMLLASGSGAAAQDGIDVRKLMTAEELRATGVSGLSEAQLEQLNAWLTRFALRVISVAQAQGVSPGASLATPAVVESKIDGDFECWEGETIFKLMNGQIWQQTQYAYRYCYKFMPKVTIVRGQNGVYRMYVEGVDGSIAVTRIR